MYIIKITLEAQDEGNRPAMVYPPDTYTSPTVLIDEINVNKTLNICF